MVINMLCNNNIKYYNVVRRYKDIERDQHSNTLYKDVQNTDPLIYDLNS